MMKLSKRAMVTLSKEEMTALETFVTDNAAAFRTIYLNTGISYNTLRKVLRGEKCEHHVAVRLNDFFKQLKTQ